MSVPERKVLKNILLKLKLKTLTSELRFRKSLEHRMNIFDSVIKVFEESSEKENEAHKKVVGLISSLRNVFSDLSLEAISLIEEYGIYIDSLEKYSSELDKAFWKGIEKKSKEIKRQIEQQEKLRKKEPSYRA